MLITWMAYAALFTAIVAVGALALDRVMAIWNGPRRFVWLAALIVSSVVPVLLAFRPSPAPEPAVMESASERVSFKLPSAVVTRQQATSRGPVSLASRAAAQTWRAPPSWNRFAGYAWIAMSVVFVALLLRGFASLRRHRASWRSASLDGRSVLITTDVGPAVVGALRPRIVVPAWVVELGAGERELMLRHEAEHIRAADPVLLVLGALAIVLFPWNAALWFVVQRLRLTIEIDCDGRVLRADARPREYGMLLLAVGARNGISLPLTASLAERRPFLERRIVAMTTLRPSRPLLVSLPFAAAAIVAATVAAQTPQPAPLPASAPKHAQHAQHAQRATPSIAPAPVIAPAIATPVVPATVVPAPAPIELPLSEPTVIPAVTPATPATPAMARPVAAALAPNSETVPFEVIRAWIQRYHPSIMTGDTSMNLVTILVDANENYVSSITDKQTNNTVPTMLENIRVGDIESVEVIKGPSAAATYGAAAANGVIVVTTKTGHGSLGRLPSDTATLGNVIRMRGTTSAASESGPIYIVDGVRIAPAVTPGKLDIDHNRIESVDVLKLAPGRIGPFALSVIVIKLKAGER